MWSALLLARPALADVTEQTLVIQVAVPGDRQVTAVEARITRGGGTPEQVVLTDAPGEELGAPYDGVWSAVVRGTPQRYVQLELTVAADGQDEAVAFNGVVRTEDMPSASVGFRLSPPDQALAAEREVFALPGHAAELSAARPVWAAFGWLWAVVLWAGALVARADAAEREHE